MVTEYGKLLRKIRIDHDEILKDMAGKLEITSAYLSSIENGKRPIPVNMTRTIVAEYDLDDLMEGKLFAAEDSIKKNVEINLNTANQSQKTVVLSLARQFEQLTDEQLEKIRQILEE